VGKCIYGYKELKGSEPRALHFILPYFMAWGLTEHRGSFAIYLSLTSMITLAT
jgi:hypothetical protein